MSETKPSETTEGEVPPDLARLFTIPLEPARALTRILLETLFHVEVEGMENIPESGGALIISNHTDYIDVLIQGTHAPRKIVYLGKQELFEPEQGLKQFLFQEGSPLNTLPLAPMKIALEAALNVFGAAQRNQLEEWGGKPIIRNFRGDSAKDAVAYYKDLEDYMVNLLKEGHLLSIFPEGTRTETGVMGPFKALAAKLAIRAQVPIIPSGISGSHKFLTMESLLNGRMFKTQLRYHVGRPNLPAEFPGGDEKKASKELTAILEKQVYALTQHPERREAKRGRARDL